MPELNTHQELNYQWKYVLPPVRGTCKKNSKSLSVCLSSFVISSSSEELVHLLTTPSHCPKSFSAKEPFTDTKYHKNKTQVNPQRQKRTSNKKIKNEEWLLPNPRRRRKKAQSLRVGSIHETPTLLLQQRRTKTLTSRREREIVTWMNEKCYLYRITRSRAHKFAEVFGTPMRPHSVASKRLICFWEKQWEFLASQTETFPENWMGKKLEARGVLI